MAWNKKERFNAKARQSAELTKLPGDAVDSNADVLIPLSTQEKEKRREVLRQQMQPEGQQMSSKKKKRLDKYIETKLKKEDSKALIEKLAASKVDTSLMHSAKNLGRAKETKRERLRRALNEERRGINANPSEELYREYPAMNEDNVDGFGYQDGSSDDEDAPALPVPSSVAQPLIPTAAPVGSGLKRSSEDGAQQPLTKRPKKAAKLAYNWRAQLAAQKGKAQDDDDSADSSDESDMSDTSDAGSWHGFEDTPDSSEKLGSTVAPDISETSPPKPAASAPTASFKQWAQQKLDEQSNTVSADPDQGVVYEFEAIDPSKLPPTRRDGTTPPPAELVSLSSAADRKSFFVSFDRPEEVQASRLLLPVVAEEQRIMEAVHSNLCIVICGETGSGKTTQVPQFLLEAGFANPDGDTPGMIGVTQPRRVAAVSMANRVAAELGKSGEDKVAYQIRFDATVKATTALKFMTDGVLLRELASDFLLQKYSVIIIDEAHERSINTDILIGVVSRVLRLRDQLSKEEGSTIKPLRLIIMSATLRVTDFTENKSLFPTPPPVLKVDARQYPVSIHFSRKTAYLDYVGETFKKVCKIHERLPHGAILVFLTGQNEIQQLCAKLRKKYPQSGLTPAASQDSSRTPKVQISGRNAGIEVEDLDLGDDSGEVLNDDMSIDESDDDDIEFPLAEGEDERDTAQPLHVLPLYSLLPTKEQMRVFEAPPEGSRLCVVATNVAETSLTIPGVRYVVDSGRAKERHYDEVSGVQSFDISWVSQASAAQRAGRAGRTGPGHCYRLFSSAVFERDFIPFTKAEILRSPIEGIVLQMKSMNIDNVINFPFPTPPDRVSLRKAENLLVFLGALNADKQITELGRTMAVFPLAPRFSKMLIIGQQHGCMPYIIAIVAALSVGEPFLREEALEGAEDDEATEDGEGQERRHTAVSKAEMSFVKNASVKESEQRKAQRKSYFIAQRRFTGLDPLCDIIKLLTAVCAYEYEGGTSTFCEQNFLRAKTMHDIHKLRQQISAIVQMNCPGVLDRFEAKLPPPTILQIKAIKQIVAAGFIDQVAIKADLLPKNQIRGSKATMQNIPYVTLFPSSSPREGQDPAVYIHASSTLMTASPAAAPDYIIYHELHRASGGSGRIRMKPLTVISGAQLAALAGPTPLITHSKPLEHPYAPRVLADSRGQKRECWVVPTMAAIGSVGPGWQLPPRKVVQVLEHGRWVNN
ncbi:P-loop containing nucleoside triphosphate hydrolase protein [Saitoella complicata NRRL Y-17804]|nr:P-loop containing nucleoside triphosphate hydrolase protein [Saitoella complicata NRRL Y-17804]ODQ54452.1 P-loop containing nucleoside triphosphate hydrolase protein [Saitoella complicata NRRL Y-17804]